MRQHVPGGRGGPSEAALPHQHSELSLCEPAPQEPGLGAPERLGAAPFPQLETTIQPNYGAKGEGDEHNPALVSEHAAKKPEITVCFTKKATLLVSGEEKHSRLPAWNSVAHYVPLPSACKEKKNCHCTARHPTLSRHVNIQTRGSPERQDWFLSYLAGDAEPWIQAGCANPDLHSQKQLRSQWLQAGMLPPLCYSQAPALHLKEVHPCFFSLPSSQHLCKQGDNKWDKTAFMQDNFCI